MSLDRGNSSVRLLLEDALQLVRLDAERGSPKYEKAALRWLEGAVPADETWEFHASRQAARELGVVRIGNRDIDLGQTRKTLGL